MSVGREIRAAHLTFLPLLPQPAGRAESTRFPGYWLSGTFDIHMLCSGWEGVQVQFVLKLPIQTACSLSDLGAQPPAQAAARRCYPNPVHHQDTPADHGQSRLGLSSACGTRLRGSGAGSPAPRPHHEPSPAPRGSHSVRDAQQRTDAF